MSYVNIWRKRIPGQRKSQCKGLEVNIAKRPEWSEWEYALFNKAL